MSELSDPIEEVRVIPGGSRGASHRSLYPSMVTAEPNEQRSRAQMIRDGILEEVEQLLRQARDQVTEAMEQFELLTTPQHRNLPTLIGQQIEEVIEYRRVKS